jgi:HSP20 family protein
MTVRRWDPLRDLFLLQERMDELFEESLSKGRQSRANAWMPLADAWELDDEFVVTLEVPGVDEADLRIDLDGEDLVVRGERRSPELRGESYHRMERIHGTFARTFRLTSPVDFEKVSAELKDGILRIELPKKSARARSIRAERTP